MNQQDIVEKLHKWMTTFVEVPNSKLGNWPPCPYARKARLNNKMAIRFATPLEFKDVINESMEALTEKEVVVICFDHKTVDAESLQKFVIEMNDFLMPINYVILEDHPDIPEYINEVNMNFGECGLMIMSKLDQLNEASDQIRSKGYYDVWSKEDLDNVVTWRYK